MPIKILNDRERIFFIVIRFYTIAKIENLVNCHIFAKIFGYGYNHIIIRRSKFGCKKMLNALLATGEFLPQKNVKVYSASDITKDEAKQIMKASAGNIMKKYEKLL